MRIGKIPVMLSAAVATPEDSTFVLMYQLTTDGLIYVKDSAGVSTLVGGSTTDVPYGECAGGSGVTYTADVSPSIPAYVEGESYRIRIDTTNVITTNPTLNLDGLGAKAIKKNGTTNLAANDMVAGRIYDFVYDGTNMVLQNNQVIAKTALTAADAAVITGGGAAVLTTADKNTIDNIRTRLNEVVAALGL